MIAVLLLGALAGALAVVPGYERAVRVLRTELNSARANEQLLLTRIASRSPAEFHAVTEARPAEPVIDKNRYLYDDTGLVQYVDEDAA